MAKKILHDELYFLTSKEFTKLRQALKQTQVTCRCLLTVLNACGRRSKQEYNAAMRILRGLPKERGAE